MFKDAHFGDKTKNMKVVTTFLLETGQWSLLEKGVLGQGTGMASGELTRESALQQAIHLLHAVFCLFYFTIKKRTILLLFLPQPTVRFISLPVETAGEDGRRVQSGTI